MIKRKRSTDFVVPLLGLFFVFLLAVLAISFYIQVQHLKKSYQRSIDNTIEQYVDQASVTVQAVVKVTELVTSNHRKSLISLLNHSNKQLASELDQQFRISAFNYGGYFLFSAQLDLIYASEQQIPRDELNFLSSHMHSYKSTSIKGSEMLATHYGKIDGVDINALYTITNIYDNDHTLQGYLIIKRPYAAYAYTLKTTKYPGFELWLVARKNHQILIGNGEYYKWNQKSNVNALLNGRSIVKRRSIISTPWEVLAVSEEGYLTDEITRLLTPKIIFLLLYIVLATWSVNFIHRTRKIHGQNLAQASVKSERAEQALGSIQEAVITTDIQGRIIYHNLTPESWLYALLEKDPQNALLKEVLLIPQAPWMDMVNIDDLSFAESENDELLVDINNHLLTLELSHQLYYVQGEIEGVVWVLRDISQQVFDREQLEENRTRYRALFEGAGVGMWHVDISLVRDWLTDLKGGSITQFINEYPEEREKLRAAFQLIDMNDTALRIYSRRNKRNPNAVINRLFKGENEKHLIEIAEKIQHQEKRFAMEVAIESVYGDINHFLVSITLDAAGLDQALISFIDISDRIAAEFALKESERFWSSVIKALPDSVYVNDLIEKKTIYASRHVAELIGYSKDETEALDHWKALIHNDDENSVRQSISALNELRPGQIRETKVRLRHKDGSWRILRFRDCVFTTNEYGQPKLFVGIGRDITEEEDAQMQLAHSERLYRLLAKGISDIVFALDVNLAPTFVSPSVNKILGVQSEEVMREGLAMMLDTDSFRRFQILGRKDIHDAQLSRHRQSEFTKIRSLDLGAQTSDGEPVILEVQSSVLFDEAGKIEGILAIGRDVTTRRNIEQEVRTAAEVFENSSESIVVTDTKGNIERVNRAFVNMTNFSFDDIKGKNPLKVLCPDAPKRIKREVINALSVDGYWQGEIDYRNRNGDVCPSWTGITALKDEFNCTQSHIVISSDITERKVTEARIQRLAYYDPLTGLPNRTQMHETLDRLMDEARMKTASSQPVAMLFIDLDRFKPINDTMGHPIGDLVLKEVALRLRASIRPEDLVARIGGDEFTVIMPGFETLEQARSEAVEESERILHQVLQPFHIQDRQLYLSASIGIAFYPEDAVNGTELLRNVDTAMYHAKAMGKNNYQFYAHEMNVRAKERLELENNLHQALTRNEFEIHYQPQWNTELNKLCGIEALLRWRRPEYGLVGPDLFIPIIEETGVIVPVGEWVLRRVCEQIIEWQESGIEVPTLAVNISARQFKDEQMLDRICRIVDETGVDPDLLELELTESILMDDVTRTLAVLNEARGMGFHISVDDFGTGYSSLSYLKQFPVDSLKIDRSFITNLPYNQEDVQITRTIVAMAKNLGLGVIAEGVENLEQQVFLKDIGCYRVQGFRYSRPVPPDIFAYQYLDETEEPELTEV